VIVIMGKVLVVGLVGQSAFMSTDHFPLPGETITSRQLFFEPGGKGMNQAVACHKFGADTVFISAIGRDANGQACKEEVARFGIKAHWIEKEEPTAFGVITTDHKGENTVNVYGGAAHALKAVDLSGPQIRSYVRECDYLLLQNEFPEEVLLALSKMAEEFDKPMVWNPAPAKKISREILPMASVITPNYGEAKVIAGFDEEKKPSDEEFATAFQNLGIKAVVITLGSEGSLLIDTKGPRRIPACVVGEAIDTTGAGDCFNGTLTACLADGKTLDEACQWAAVAAGISVTRRGATACIPDYEETKAVYYMKRA